MNVESLFFTAVFLLVLSGVPGALLGRRSSFGAALSALANVTGCLSGLAAVALFFATGQTFALSIPSPFPAYRLTLSLDAISALFLAPIFLISGLGALYGVRYWSPNEHPGNGRRLRLFYGWLAAALAVLVVAADGLTFLLAWEVMAVAGFFLVNTEDEKPEVRQAAWLYLAVSHFATLCLFGMFSLIAAATGSFAFVSLGGIGPGFATGIFVLALLGFGVKAGLMPLHIWLPSAHAMAPSHVSALLSGVVIKMGIYGLVRTTSLFPDPPLWWGNVVLALGVISGVLGVAFAIGQHDIKRLLAYHSIENIGIIAMGLGLALIGRSLHQHQWVVLGMAGAYLHVWNHATFKSLLFYSAGSVIHATHTREIDHLGGLGRPMPLTSMGFLIGAVAICGLPPLNGFVSELFIFLGLFKTLGLEGRTSWELAAFAAPFLAMIGALATACFVKVFGAVFLGVPRSEHARHVHESPAAMTAPMIVLAAVCFLIGLAPVLTVRCLNAGIAAWDPRSSYDLEGIAPVNEVSLGAAILLMLLVGLTFLLRLQMRRHPVERGPTWGCGFLGRMPRGQYTSSSFAQMLVDLFAWAMRPRKSVPKIERLFPPTAHFESHVLDTVLDGAVLPSSRFLNRAFAWSRILHQGSIQAYLMYIVVTVIVLLLWS